VAYWYQLEPHKPLATLPPGCPAAGPNTACGINRTRINRCLRTDQVGNYSAAVVELGSLNLSGKCEVSPSQTSAQIDGETRHIR
jgi:hypothetical protein